MVVTEQVISRMAQLPPALQREVLDFVEFLAQRVAPPLATEAQAMEAQLRAQGYQHFGIFAQDPDALALFDEIEQERDRHTIGGV